jgi:sugar fermentation stimulation protein A
MKKAKLIKRYKRFLVDIQLDGGSTMTVHCPNSGSMRDCFKAGWPCLYSLSDNPKRKLAGTLEFVHNGKTWIGVNTHRTNKLAKEALESHVFKWLPEHYQIRSEVTTGKSRIDFLLEYDDVRFWLEVKSVTMIENGYYSFPDAVTKRGVKHLEELIDLKKQGERAGLLLIIQRNDGEGFTPARAIDPNWADTLNAAIQCGVEVYAHQAIFNEEDLSYGVSPIPEDICLKN